MLFTNPTPEPSRPVPILRSYAYQPESRYPLAAVSFPLLTTTAIHGDHEQAFCCSAPSVPYFALRFLLSNPPTSTVYVSVFQPFSWHLAKGKRKNEPPHERLLRTSMIAPKKTDAVKLAHRASLISGPSRNSFPHHSSSPTEKNLTTQFKRQPFSKLIMPKCSTCQDIKT